MELLAEQQNSIIHLQTWKVGALFMDAGTGKTRAAAELIKKTSCDLILYVCPIRTIQNTKNELEKWGIEISNFVFTGIESIGLSERIYLDTLSKVKNSSCPFIIVDESLKIKNIKAKRTQRLLNLGKFAEYKLILNGTPISKNLLDLYPQMQFLSPKILNMNETQFKNTFCEYIRITKHYGSISNTKEIIKSYANIDYLYILISPYIYECDLNLMIKQRYKTLHYNIDQASKDIYTEIKAKYLDSEKMEIMNNNIFLEMTQKMQHSYCCTEDKFAIIDKLFTQIDPNETIIFCKYIKSREECEKRYPLAKVLSYQKDALGLNLQIYNNTIYFDKIWDYALRVQAARRTYRTGQKLDCKYYDLSGRIRLESLIDSNIERKISMTEYFKSKTKHQIYEDL